MKTKTIEMCFGFIPPDQRSYSNENCRALNCDCPGFGCCPFYKSIAAHRADRTAANEKLRKLPVEKQMEIAQKYYFGEMPWRYEDENV